MKVLITGLLFLLFMENDYKTPYYDGYNLLLKGKYEDAIPKFEASYQIKKISKTSYYLAYCHFQRREYDLSFQLAERALSEEPALPHTPYGATLESIIEYHTKADRFKNIKIKVLNSDESDDPSQKQEIDESMQEYYQGKDGYNRYLRDLNQYFNPRLPVASRITGIDSI
jgi:hypothetical protein